VSTLSRLIASEIKDHGPIPVSRFMDLALAHPEHGYYRTRDPLGQTGDFITAPEISQMFGEIIGLWAAVVWQSLGCPDPFILAEFGPGRGTMMADALRAAKLQPGFVEAAHIHLVETSPTLRAHQKETLAGHHPIWHDTIEDLPQGPSIIIANEFFDALPIQQFLLGEHGWTERLIAGGDPFHFVASKPIPDAIRLAENLPETSPPNTIKETCPAALAIAESIARRLVEHSGACLIIDYGYADDAVGETWQAIQHHEFVDPLIDPGDSDLTAHVNFKALCQAGRAGGASCFGPVTQGAFLMDLGIGQRAQRLNKNATPEQIEVIDASLRRLIAPSEMGNLFKVMALASPDLETLPGLSQNSEAQNIEAQNTVAPS
jgi:NADH dehydrogenase [ubiquinone] 1 alpha subcomplex assembly factor 7